MSATVSSSNFASTATSFFDAYNRHDIDGMLALCSDDATYDYVPYGEQGRGRVHDSAAGVWGGFVDALPDFHVRVERVIETTERTVVVEDVQGGTQAKDIAGIASRGRATFVPHCFVLDFDEAGLISHLRVYWDNNSIYAQLGHTESHT